LALGGSLTLSGASWRFGASRLLAPLALAGLSAFFCSFMTLQRFGAAMCFGASRLCDALAPLTLWRCYALWRFVTL